MRKKCTIITMLITGIMALPSFGQESFNAENGGLNYVLPADNGYYFLCSGHIYFWNGDVTKQAVPLCSRPNCSHTTEDCSSFEMHLERCTK